MRSTVLPLSDHHRGAILFALLQQVPCAVLCLLLLDGGHMARVCGVAMLGFWGAAALVMARRPSPHSPGDLLFLRWGFLPVFALTIALARLA